MQWRATRKLDFTSVETTLHGLLAAGIIDSTWKVYRTGSNAYYRFYEQFQLPTSERILMLLMAYLGQKSSTAKSYLAVVVHFMQIELGLGSPLIGQMYQLEYMLKGLKRTSAAFGKRARLPITPAILQAMRGV